MTFKKTDKHTRACLHNLKIAAAIKLPCKYCSSLVPKSSINRHEKGCKLNPANAPIEYHPSDLHRIVVDYHLRGFSVYAMVHILKRAKATIRWHINQYKTGNTPEARVGSTINWTAIQTFYDEGNSLRACIEKFPHSNATFEKAVKRGDLITRKKIAAPLNEILADGRKYNRGHLKRRMIEEGIVPHECSICHRLPLWEDRPLVLVLDHINGVNNDNRLENLRLLCPNCNSQTDTFAGRNTKKVKQKRQSEALFLDLDSGQTTV